MPFQPTESINELIGRLIAESKGTMPEDQQLHLEAFLSQYYLYIAPEDLAEQKFSDIKGAALAHWHLARQRQAGEFIVHVYNPQFESHGWQSTHTIVEIVAEDMPFLVDSVSMALTRHDLTIHLITHPVLKVKRNPQGELLEVLPANTSAGAASESFMQFQVDRQTDPDVLDSIHQAVERTLADVRIACLDWRAMRAKTLEIIDGLKKAVPHATKEIVDEAREFLQWIEDNHFTYLGYCEYQLDKTDQNRCLSVIPETGLGLLRAGEGSDSISVLPTEMQDYGKNKDFLAVAKANSRSTIHRRAYMDYIGIKRYDEDGTIIGERCILGLFTSAAYNRNTRSIPLIRQKVDHVFKESGLIPSSHDGKTLQNIIETYPRDSLFQLSENELLENAMGILKLQERARIRMFMRRDNYGRYYSFLVYVPRERYNSDLRIRFQEILMECCSGLSAEFNTFFSESVLARIHFTIYTRPGEESRLSARELEYKLIEAAHTWQDQLREALLEQYGEERGNHLIDRYGGAFSGGYQDYYPAQTAALDIEKIEHGLKTQSLVINFYRPMTPTGKQVNLKLYSPGDSIPLTNILPMIENMGLKVLGERPFKIRTAKGQQVWIHEFILVDSDDTKIDTDKIRSRFQEALAKIWTGDVENDGFNRLVLGAGLDWRGTVVFRAYCRYLRQIRIRYSESYMIESLGRNPRLVTALIALFKQRFDPDFDESQRSAHTDSTEQEIENLLDDVANLDEDRIIRAYHNLIQATIRTNFFQSENAEAKPYLSFKFDPSLIPRMPLPRPMFEIFVYSPRVEAVHLRGGKVARGGLRWSDRREDFRTEILGLVKAQMVKNAVIVPMGSKGGFVVKRQPVEREALMKEVVSCYQIFMRGLLDLTDNLKNGDVVPPENVVRHDADDPYLVIAADKGTATFSDIANEKSREYGFWLGDGFASGGSIGYDHKKMGITARGAWESVKRHFRELGTDIQATDFTVIGIGDMSGDVFGNGMLLSRHIRLLAAFNHMHIFIDPNPDAESSFKERERLFQLPRSSWTDYSGELISKGGGIFDRSAKSITLTPEIKDMLKITSDRLSPNDLIHAILKAPADLLWNGGIGTYIKSAEESHEDVRDRANDGLRVDGGELRCRVIGEGGNLGVTQLGRIEYSASGGLCYTDSIDNSGGVDCSDHEVNIKILLNAIVNAGDMTEKQRVKLLAEMTDEVSGLVLRNNYAQSQAISVSASRAPDLLVEHGRFIAMLENSGKLNRELEYLPSRKTISERHANQLGLYRPEIAILISYSKLHLYEEVLNSDVPEDPFLSVELGRYFPDRLHRDFREPMYNHRLKREIIATHIINNMVNSMGPTFAFRLGEFSGAKSPEIVRAYSATREIMNIDSTWQEIESLDNRIPAGTQTEMLIDSSGLIERTSLWLLRNRPRPLDIASTVAYFHDGIAELLAAMPKCLSAKTRLSYRKRSKYYLTAGVPAELAARIAAYYPMSSALDIVEVAKHTGQPIPFVAGVYFQIGEILELHWLRERIARLVSTNHWHTLAKSSLRSNLHTTQRLLTAEVLKGDLHGKRAKATVNAWVEGNVETITRFSRTIADLRALDNIDFAMLSVALGEAQSVVPRNQEAA